jgi:hypothetical protein
MIGGYYTAVIHRFGWQVILIVTTNGGWRELIAFFVSWTCLKPLYEIGYLINDCWAEPREKKINIKPSKSWIKLIVPRILFSIIMGVVLWLIVPNTNQAKFSYIIIILTLIIFTIHNYLEPHKRPLTYYLLQLSKGALVVPFLTGPINDLAIWSCIAIPAFTATPNYIRHKGLFIFSPFAKYLDHLVWQLRLSVIMFIGCFTTIWLIQGNASELLQRIIAYYLAFDCLTSCVTFIKASRRSKIRRDFIQHVHSEYSHDSIISLNCTPHYATLAGFKACFMTEHAEDFNAKRYNEYQSKIKHINEMENNCVLIAGLEFPILKQHILACNLRTYVETNPLDINSIDYIRSESDKVVWAHPMFSIRRIMDPKYIIELLMIASKVDGVEWASGKFDRPNNYFARRHLVVAFLIHIIWPHKEISFGYDVHRLQDWERIKDS